MAVVINSLLNLSGTSKMADKDCVVARVGAERAASALLREGVPKAHFLFPFCRSLTHSSLPHSRQTTNQVYREVKKYW